MKPPILLCILLLIVNACTENDTTCWECKIVTITNEPFICVDPEQIEVRDEENVQIICDEREKANFISENEATSERLEKNCTAEVRYYTVTKSPVCEIQ